MSKRQLSDLEGERATLIDQMKAQAESQDFDLKKYDEIEAQVVALDEHIVRYKKQQEYQRSIAKPAAKDDGAEDAQRHDDLFASRAFLRGDDLRLFPRTQADDDVHVGVEQPQ